MVLKESAEKPIAVFSLAGSIVLEAPQDPSAVLSLPVVLLESVGTPVAVL